MQVAGENVNMILLMVIGGAALLYLCAWMSPKGCRHLSLYFFVRAEQLEAGRNAAKEARMANEALLNGIKNAEVKPRRRRKPVAVMPSPVVAGE